MVLQRPQEGIGGETNHILSPDDRVRVVDGRTGPKGRVRSLGDQTVNDFGSSVRLRKRSEVSIA